MRLKTMRGELWAGLLLGAVFLAAHVAGAQTAATRRSYPEHLPYRFENFVWWSDDALRALLKQRIAGLGEEIATTHAAESRMRDALTELLKQKGVIAHVQSEEPSYSAVAPQPAEMFGMPLPEPPAPVIAFRIQTPEIIIGKITVGAGDPALSQIVQGMVNGDEGKPYSLESQAFSIRYIEEKLAEQGYLTAKARIQHAPPRAEGGRYKVDLALLVDAGPQFRIGSISADGGPLLLGRDLSRFFSAKPGDTGGISPFRRLGPQLRAYYNQAGYADAWPHEDVQLDRARALVSYRLTVEPGPLYHLRSVTIHKLNTEQEAKVRELLGMHPGDVFRDNAINELYRKIAAEPLLKGYSFSFSPQRDKAAAVVELTLDFYKEGGESQITIR